jgi:HPt (histidine-containing phosphotransfer) domain-containing protein
MNGFLSKPVGLDKLRETLLEWLPAPPARETAQTASAAPAETAAPVFDEGGLLHRLLDDRDLAAAVVNGFVHDCPLQLALLAERIAQADAQGARSQAHRVKGASACVSAGSLCAVGLEMERAAEAKDLGRVGALLPRATEEFERLRTVLQAAGCRRPGGSPRPRTCYNKTYWKSIRTPSPLAGSRHAGSPPQTNR